MSLSCGRRFVVVAAVVAALSMVLAGNPASAQEGPTPGTPPEAGWGPVSPQKAPPHGLIPHGDWTPPQIGWMLDQIEWVEEVLPERFPTSYSDGGSELQAMGFYNFGATAPGGYDHWINPAWLFDEHILNPTFSESLVYQHVGGGVWELKSAMFMLAPGIEVEDLHPLIAWIPGWHGHPELCVGPGGTFAGITDPDNPDCPPGSSPATTPIMMHVWLEDPGCGHRFGGIGVTGLHCEHH